MHSNSYIEKTAFCKYIRVRIIEISRHSKPFKYSKLSKAHNYSNIFSGCHSNARFSFQHCKIQYNRQIRICTVFKAQARIFYIRTPGIVNVTTSPFHIICDVAPRSLTYPTQKRSINASETDPSRALLSFTQKSFDFQSDAEFTNRVRPHEPLFRLTLATTELVFILTFASLNLCLMSSMLVQIC